MRRILSITGTRADYGLMKPVHMAIGQNPDLKLGLLVTGMHFLSGFEDSLAELRAEKVGDLIEVEIADVDSVPASMAIKLGEHIQAFTPHFLQFKPDIVLLQGDRGEMLAGAIVAAHLNIPVVHMSGGDKSGTIDDSIRHAITKFAHIHLPTCEASKENLLSMGEELQRIEVVGEPALDIIKDFSPLSRENLNLKFPFMTFLNGPFLIVAQHSVTNEVDDAGSQMEETLAAVKDSGLKAIVTAPNSDAGSAQIANKISHYLEAFPDQFFYVPHLGQKNFYSLLSYATALVGNTSAGILESSSFKIPSINIGTRQHGRTRAGNVIDVGYDRSDILLGILKAQNPEYISSLQDIQNPYGSGNTARETVDLLTRLKLEPGLLSKWIKGFKPL